MTARAPVKLVALTRNSLAILAVSMVAGCVYFNALYNSERLFNRGRKDIEAGNLASGRATLGMSIEKAEGILERSPDSRWADDALQLITRARLLREEWEEAAQASRRLMQGAKARRDSANAAGYLGIAVGQLGHPELADSLLSVALAEAEDRDERATLMFHRGIARVQLGQVDVAEDDLRAASELKSDWIAPRLELVALLAGTDRLSEAAYGFAHVLELDGGGPVEEAIVQSAERLGAVSPETGAHALADVESSELRSANKARLMKLRGDLRVTVGELEKARADYESVPKTAPDSRAAVDAYVALARIELKDISRPEELERPRSLLEQAASIPLGRRVVELHSLLDVVKRCEFWVDHGDLGYLAAGEAARDELGAPALARYLFLEYVRRQPDDLWAAKAILAALDLTGVDSGPQTDGTSDEPGREELQRRLLEDYRDTAYVQVLLGETGSRFNYEELETGLRRQLQRLKRLADQQLSRRVSPTPRR